MPDRRLAAGLLTAGLLLPEPAAAHAPIEGIEGFYIGLVHPLTSPAQVLILVALGVVFGQRWPNNVGIALALFAAACFGGIVLGQVGVPFDTAETILLALALLAGALGALWPASPVVLGFLAAAIAGVLIGLASTPDPGPFRPTAITLFGSFVGATVLLLYSAGGLGAIHEKTTKPWVRIGLRVVAAWVAAIASILLALALGNPQTTVAML